jgi:hypothetical protein
MNYDSGKEGLLETLGIAGMVVTAAVMVQHALMVHFRADWAKPVLLLADSVVFFTYLLLYRMRPLACRLLYVSGGILLLQQALFLVGGLLIWLPLLLFLYTGVALALVYTRELPLYMAELDAEQKREIV